MPAWTRPGGTLLIVRRLCWLSCNLPRHWALRWAPCKASGVGLSHNSDKPPRRSEQLRGILLLMLVALGQSHQDPNPAARLVLPSACGRRHGVGGGPRACSAELASDPIVPSPPTRLGQGSPLKRPTSTARRAHAHRQLGINSFMAASSAGVAAGLIPLLSWSRAVPFVSYVGCWGCVGSCLGQ